MGSSGCGDVCVYVGDYDHADFYDVRTPKAAKEHRCCECGDEIERLALYERIKMLCDGRWWESKTCLDCVEIRDILMCEGWMFGFVWEEIADQAFPIWKDTSPSECLAQIKGKSARDKLATRFAEWLKEQDDD